MSKNDDGLKLPHDYLSTLVKLMELGMKMGVGAGFNCKYDGNNSSWNQWTLIRSFRALQKPRTQEGVVKMGFISFGCIYPFNKTKFL